MLRMPVILLGIPDASWHTGCLLLPLVTVRHSAVPHFTVTLSRSVY